MGLSAESGKIAEFLAVIEMKGTSLWIASAVLIAGCSRPDSSTPDLKVEVSREITAEDKLLYRSTTWSMTVTPQRLFFHRMEADPDLTRSLESRMKDMTFDNSDIANVVFSTFLKWDEAARQNKVEPFSKSIRKDYTFDFANSASTLFYVDRGFKTRSYTFDQTDIQKFSELLKQFPEAKAELDLKVQKAKRESALFKDIENSERATAPSPTTR